MSPSSPKTFLRIRDAFSTAEIKITLTMSLQSFLKHLLLKGNVLQFPQQPHSVTHLTFLITGAAWKMLH